MAGTRRVEIKKFNGMNFELWKLKVQDILVKCDMWGVVSKKNLLGMRQED